MLRDRIVCGCRDNRLQCKLLASETGLNFAKAFAQAKAMEAAEREAKDLQTTPSSSQVHSLRDQPRAPRHPRGKPPRKARSPTVCFRCGANHAPDSCKYKTFDCNHCGKKGHLAKVCRSKLNQTPKFPRAHPTHQVDLQPKESTEYDMWFSFSDTPTPMQVKLTVSDAEIPMEVDTGAALSIISDDTYRSVWASDDAPLLKPCTACLKTYTDDIIPVKGALDVQVTHRDTSKQLSLIVVEGSGPSLMGRDWLRHIRLDWSNLHSVRSSVHSRCQEIVDKHSKVFADGLGHLKKTEAHLYVDPTAQPEFYKARSVPYALRGKVEAELDRLQRQGVIEPVQFADWAAPIVPVVKSDGTIRICGDYKLTVNRVAKTDAYPLPRIEDIFASLSKGKLFTKLDLAHAYQQVPMATESKKYTTVNTTK